MARCRQLLSMLLLLLLTVIARISCDGHGITQPRGPDVDKTATASTTTSVDENNPQGNLPEGGENVGECPAEDEQSCSGSRELCLWRSAEGATFDLNIFNTRQFDISLPNPRGSVLKFQLCPHATLNPLINCNNEKRSLTCLTVPGVKPTSAGMLPRLEQLEPNIPGSGFKLIYEDGETCEVTNQPRLTTITLPCNPFANYKPQHFNPRKAWEGQKSEVCHYFVEFSPSSFGCPTLFSETTVDGDVSEQQRGIMTTSPLLPQIWAVSGCEDSTPTRTTEDCHFAGKVRLVLHGLNFDHFCNDVTAPQDGTTTDNSGSASPFRFNTAQCTDNFNKYYGVYVGDIKCQTVSVLSPFQINCTIEGAHGLSVDIVIKKLTEKHDAGLHSHMEPLSILMQAVSFKEPINFRDKFAKFVELGVGGLKKEIDELYRRAFASRGTPPEVLEKLGISHVKGILLYGPPGAGKTLLARTIAQILGSKQVELINGPEIISKYLGESEKNLRSHFKVAQDAWKELGPQSDLFVIIIDEIDAICKPRGKTDQSAAGVAYDALVNQLLTLMDGLSEVHNTLVVGLTNRKELLDPALLRPGRFEVQIEIGLPDEEGRREIFEIHTRSMRESDMLSPDVNLFDLAANTTRFSGAEIAGVVRAAASYALERSQLSNSSGAGSVVVNARDFQDAILAINPAYTHSEAHVVSSYLPLGYLPCGDAHDAVIDESLELIHTLKQSSTARMQTLLLYGPRGSGKTALAAHLAMMGKFSFVKIFTATELVGRPDIIKVDLLHQTFNDAFKSDSAIIVLDDLHRLVEFIQVGSQLQISHSMLHSINTLLTTTPPPSSKLLVVGTMTLPEAAALDEPAALNLPELFLQHQFVPMLDAKSVLMFIASRNIHRLGGGPFSLPTNLAISIQQLVHAIECVCTDSGTSCGSGPSGRSTTLVQQDLLLDCIMAFVGKHDSQVQESLYQA